MELAKGANAGMMNMIIDDVGGDDEIEGCVCGVSECDELPRRAKVLLGLVRLQLSTVRVLLLLGTSNRSLCLLSSSDFDQVSHKQVTRHRKEQQSSQSDILPSVVMATYTNEDAVL